MAEPTLPGEPNADRPTMFGGHLEPVLLPWSWATHRLTVARNYWIATTRPDNRPHTRPVWGVWLDDAFFFSTGSLAAGSLPDRPVLRGAAARRVRLDVGRHRARRRCRLPRDHDPVDVLNDLI